MAASLSPKYGNGIHSRSVSVPTLGTGTEKGTGQFSKLSTGTERRWLDFRNSVRERKQEPVKFQKQVQTRIFRHEW